MKICYNIYINSKYREGTYLGCEAVYLEFPNPNPPPKISVSSGKNLHRGEGGGRGNMGLDPLPKVAQPYSSKNTLCQGMVLNNFIINGPLLSTIDSLPPGNTPCYSLTQTKEVATTMREGGAVFTDIAIVPLVSNYAREGYLHKEEVEEIYRNIISVLK